MIDLQQLPDVDHWVLANFRDWRAPVPPRRADRASIQRESFVDAWNVVSHGGEDEDTAWREVGDAFDRLRALGYLGARSLGWYYLSDSGKEAARQAWLLRSIQAANQSQRSQEAEEPQAVAPTTERTQPPAPVVDGLLDSVTFTQAEIARIYGKSPSTINKWAKSTELRDDRPRFMRDRGKPYTTLREVLCTLDRPRWVAFREEVRDLGRLTAQIRGRLEELAGHLQVHDSRDYLEGFQIVRGRTIRVNTDS